MKLVLFVYIGALLKSGNVVCRKQSLACEVGKLEKSYRKFQSTSEPNLCAVCQQLSSGRCRLNAGGGQCLVQKQLNGAGR